MYYSSENLKHNSRLCPKWQRNGVKADECRRVEVILSLLKEWEYQHTCFDKMIDSTLSERNYHFIAERKNQ